MIYTAKDYSGNKSDKKYVIHAGGDIDPITIALPHVETEIKLGYPIDLKGAVVEGGSGDKTIKITATYGDETIEIYDGYRFEKAGIWKIVYTATDYVGTVKSSKPITINAVASEEPFFNESVNFAPVFIDGSEYLLPELYCDDYSSGKQEKKRCSVKVEYDSGKTETYVSGDTFIPTVKNNGDKIKITYYCGKEEYNNGTTEIAVLKIRNDQEIDCSKYFYGNGFITSYVDDDGNEFDKLLLGKENGVFTAPSGIEGSLEEITLSGITVSVSTDGNKAFLNKELIPVGGNEKCLADMVIYTDEYKYNATAEICTKILTEATDFDAFKMAEGDYIRQNLLNCSTRAINFKRKSLNS